MPLSDLLGSVWAPTANREDRKVDTCFLGQMNAVQSRNVQSVVIVSDCSIRDKSSDTWIFLWRTSDNEISVSGSVSGNYVSNSLSKDPSAPWQSGLHRVDLSEFVSLGCGQSLTSHYFKLK